jgi:hypothetical protein
MLYASPRSGRQAAVVPLVISWGWRRLDEKAKRTRKKTYCLVCCLFFRTAWHGTWLVRIRLCRRVFLVSPQKKKTNSKRKHKCLLVVYFLVSGPALRIPPRSCASLPRFSFRRLFPGCFPLFWFVFLTTASEARLAACSRALSRSRAARAARGAAHYRSRTALSGLAASNQSKTKQCLGTWAEQQRKVLFADGVVASSGRSRCARSARHSLEQISGFRSCFFLSFD